MNRGPTRKLQFGLRVLCVSAVNFSAPAQSRRSAVNGERDERRGLRNRGLPGRPTRLGEPGGFALALSLHQELLVGRADGVCVEAMLECLVQAVELEVRGAAFVGTIQKRTVLAAVGHGVSPCNQPGLFIVIWPSES